MPRRPHGTDSCPAVVRRATPWGHSRTTAIVPDARTPNACGRDPEEETGPLGDPRKFPLLYARVRMAWRCTYLR
jgi:hypothetical protein